MIKDRILNEIERKLISEGKNWDEGTTIKLEITEEERKEFLNSSNFDNGFWWEFEKLNNNNWNLTVSI